MPKDTSMTSRQVAALLADLDHMTYERDRWRERAQNAEGWAAFTTRRDG